MIKFLPFLFLPLLAAQGAKTVLLTWNDLLNPVGTTYNVYKCPGACTLTSGTFTVLKSGVTVKTYTDIPVEVGPITYAVTAVNGTQESLKSNLSGVSILAPPTNLTTIVITVIVGP